MTTTIAGCASRISVSSAPATTRVSSGQSKDNPIAFSCSVQIDEDQSVGGQGGVVVAQCEVIVASEYGHIRYADCAKKFGCASGLLSDWTLTWVVS